MPKKLWEPGSKRIHESNMYRFMNHVNKTYGYQFETYDQLYRWSVDHISDFWKEMWDFSEIKASSPYERVVHSTDQMMNAKWFPGARLNFAENLLRFRDDSPAILFKGETRNTLSISYAKLYEDVSRLAAGFKQAGVTPGDCVAGFMPNIPETIIAMLAATSIGAMWTSCSPDFGIKGVLDRFGQIHPKIVITADGYLFKGRAIDSIDRIASVIKKLPSVESVIVVPYTQEKPDISKIQKAVEYETFISESNEETEIQFEQLPFDHPLYIMYSSGTTGLPKCMVQSAGGILIHHLKELILHTDIKKSDTIFYYTTCGWMMWNWLTSALATGATIVLYDGHPFYPGPGALWQMAQDEKISVFGTSAGYISALMASGIKPIHEYDLTHLKSVLSTGAPLSVEGFDYVYSCVHSDIQLASISGGTDLNGCFALGNPLDPVYAGELQGRGLAMNVAAYNDQGDPVINTQGELVCTAPFPSMPIYFWDDLDNEKYKKAYFNVYDNTWCHGDFIEINDRGGVVIYGRSDATLNPGGVRIGTSDLYRQIEQFQEITDSIVIGQNWKDDVRVILFVQMSDGYDLSIDLKKRIKDGIKTNVSPRHVPAKILAVRDVPYTLNMKKVELAVKKTVEGVPVLNKDALKNPEALEAFKGLSELYED